MSLARHPSRDLLAAAVLALVAALAALLPLSGWLQFVLLAPLALALPGYAISAALFPPRTVTAVERCVYVFVFSLSTAAIGGIVVQLVFALDRTLWVLLEVAVTLAAVAAAQRRRAKLPIQLQEDGRRRGGAGRRHRLRLPLVLGLAIAAALAILAVAIASDGVREQRARQVFASLWAVPVGGESGEPVPVRVGVWNHGAPSSYSLQVSAGGRVLGHLPVRLETRQKWEKTLSPPPDAATGDLELTLFHGGTSYRKVVLNIGVGR
jgi:uncharacterized membrane protein